MKKIVGIGVGVMLGVVVLGTKSDAVGQECHGSCELPVETRVDAVPEVVSVCGKGMIRVSGSYCPNVFEKCLRWLDKDKDPKKNWGIGPLRCAEFEKPTKCLSKTRKQLDFCMSVFEYPGEGTYPLVGMDYYEAKKMAEKDGNRLCTVDEWNFACRGEHDHPYGYGDGFHRDDGSLGCNIDKEHIDYSKFPRSSWNDTNGGLYQGIRSDRTSHCVSDEGIYNLNGNVDEILDSEHDKNVILASGYWGQIRARCGAKTRDIHSKLFSFYQVGMRTCSDVRK